MAQAVIQTNYTPSYITIYEWDGLTRGDAVRIKDERGSFTFVSADEKDGEVISVTVHGGVHGHETMRAFYPHRVSKAPVKRKRKAVSADE
jgi:hypothetical protein